MNERFIEIARQATGKDYSMFIFSPSDFDSHEKLEKFAKLIIRECLDIADRQGAYEVMDSIIEKFNLENTL